MTIYNLGNIKGEKGDRGECSPGPTGPTGVGIKSIEQITHKKFKFCLTDGSEYIIDYDTGSFDGMVVTCDKSILSAADGEFATLSAQVTSGGFPVPFAGELITFEVRKQSDDSLVETLTDITDGTGKASVEYFGNGVGDVYVKCQCRSFIETYDIEDAIKYISNTLTSSQTISISDLPTNFKCKFKLQTPINFGSTNTAWFEVGSDDSNCIIFGDTESIGGMGIYVRIGGSYVANDKQICLTPNSWIDLDYSYDNGVHTLSDGINTVTLNNSQITARDYVYFRCVTNSIKEILFLPL